MSEELHELVNFLIPPHFETLTPTKLQQLVIRNTSVIIGMYLSGKIEKTQIKELAEELGKMIKAG